MGKKVAIIVIALVVMYLIGGFIYVSQKNSGVQVSKSSANMRADIDDGRAGGGSSFDSLDYLYGWWW